jgi:hypothetical protein
MTPPLFGGVLEAKINTLFHRRPNSRNKPAVRPAARPGAGGNRYRASRSSYPNLAKGPRRPCSWPSPPRVAVDSAEDVVSGANPLDPVLVAFFENLTLLIFAELLSRLDFRQPYSARADRSGR